MQFWLDSVDYIMHTKDKCDSFFVDLAILFFNFVSHFALPHGRVLICCIFVCNFQFSFD